MELLKPILGATVLMGIHITGPLLNVLKDPKTKHSDLKNVFPTLYSDLFYNFSTDKILCNSTILGMKIFIIKPKN